MIRVVIGSVGNFNQVPGSNPGLDTFRSSWKITGGIRGLNTFSKYVMCMCKNEGGEELMKGFIVLYFLYCNENDAICF